MHSVHDASCTAHARMRLRACITCRPRALLQHPCPGQLEVYTKPPTWNVNAGLDIKPFAGAYRPVTVLRHSRVHIHTPCLQQEVPWQCPAAGPAGQESTSGRSCSRSRSWLHLCASRVSLWQAPQYAAVAQVIALLQGSCRHEHTAGWCATACHQAACKHLLLQCTGTTPKVAGNGRRPTISNR